MPLENDIAKILSSESLEHAACEQPIVINTYDDGFITLPLWGESVGHRKIPLSKASNVDFDVLVLCC